VAVCRPFFEQQNDEIIGEFSNTIYCEDSATEIQRVFCNKDGNTYFLEASSLWYTLIRSKKTEKHLSKTKEI
jgi:hypothetical protein